MTYTAPTPGASASGQPRTRRYIDPASFTATQRARYSHLYHLLYARHHREDGYTYADHQARKAREYAAQDSRQASPYHYGR